MTQMIFLFIFIFDVLMPLSAIF